jgi:hypothetical protein
MNLVAKQDIIAIYNVILINSVTKQIHPNANISLCICGFFFWVRLNFRKFLTCSLKSVNRRPVSKSSHY